MIDGLSSLKHDSQQQEAATAETQVVEPCSSSGVEADERITHVLILTVFNVEPGPSLGCTNTHFLLDDTTAQLMTFGSARSWCDVTMWFGLSEVRTCDKDRTKYADHHRRGRSSMTEPSGENDKT